MRTQAARSSRNDRRSGLSLLWRRLPAVGRIGVWAGAARQGGGRRAGQPRGHLRQGGHGSQDDYRARSCRAAVAARRSRSRSSARLVEDGARRCGFSSGGDRRAPRPRLGCLLRQRPTRQPGGLFAVKLFKGSLGTNNTDSNSRLCMATAVAAYRTSLGSDGPPACYEDIDEADVILVVGSNMAEAHPVTFDRILARARRDRISSSSSSIRGERPRPTGPICTSPCCPAETSRC